MRSRSGARTAASHWPTMAPSLTIPRSCTASAAPYARGQRSAIESSVARECVRALGRWDECLLWVRTWGVWGSSENWPAYYALRGARGQRRALEKAPGHLLERVDKED